MLQKLRVNYKENKIIAIKLSKNSLMQINQNAKKIVKRQMKTLNKLIRVH